MCVCEAGMSVVSKCVRPIGVLLVSVCGVLIVSVCMGGGGE